MYNEHFGFTASPFENNLDQRFLYLSRDHKEVLAALQYFIRENKAFAILCGDVGTGKTMIVNSFLRQLPKAYHPIIISNPAVEFREIASYVARILGISETGKTILELIDDIKAGLIEALKENRQYFLIIDEAHLLPDQSLDDIRLVSNIETSDKKLLQILLVGQYELSYKLRSPKMRQLRQRLNINRFLSSLDYEETKNYIDHRLQVVGSSVEACFQPECMPLIYKLTNGVPREINRLCDSALLVCKGDGLQKVDKATLQKANRALRSDLIFTPSTPARGLQRGFGFLPHVRPSLTGAATLAILLLAVSLFFRSGPLWTPAAPDPNRDIVAGSAPFDATRSNPSSPAETMTQPAVAESTLETAAENPAVSPADSTSAETTPAPAENTLSVSPPSPKNPGIVESETLTSPGLKDELPLPSPDASLLSPSSSREEAEYSDAVPAKAALDEPTNAAALFDQHSSPVSPPENSREGSPATTAIPQDTAPPSQPDVASLAPPTPGAAPAPQAEDSGSTQLSEQLPSRMAPDGDTVTVRKGDTLSTIVSRRSPESVTSTIDALLEINPFIKDRDLIFPGQVLLFPKVTEASPPLDRSAGPRQSGFTIQVCTLSRSSRAVAEDYASYLKGKGYPTHVEEIRAHDGNTMFKICIGKYQTEAEAIEAAMYFQEKEGKPFIIMRSEPDGASSEPAAAR